MAWRCSASSNSELISNLYKFSIITKPIVEVMSKVDRKYYCPFDPYKDSPETIGYGATISAPHMHGHALAQLESFLHDGAKVLDVGSGSGYLTACFAHFVQPSGVVYGIDHITELVDMARRNIRKDKPEFLEKGIIKLVVGDGRAGIPGEQFDAIHVGAAAPTLPQALVDQLKSPGRMIIPVGQHSQSLLQVDKSRDGKITKRELMGVMYVPLTDKESQVRYQ